MLRILGIRIGLVDCRIPWNCPFKVSSLVTSACRRSCRTTHTHRYRKTKAGQVINDWKTSRHERQTYVHTDKHIGLFQRNLNSADFTILAPRTPSLPSTAMHQSDTAASSKAHGLTYHSHLSSDAFPRLLFAVSNALIYPTPGLHLYFGLPCLELPYAYLGFGDAVRVDAV